MTNKNSISDEVLDEIERLKADKVVIVGGQSSISSSVESRLKKEDIKVTRISGRDRFDTSDKLSQEVSRLSKKSSQAILVNGYKNIDALSVSSLATKEDLPILLNGRNTLNMSVKNRLKQMNVKKVYIIGGNNSISSDVEKELNRMQISVVRLSGTDRYETSANIAKYAYKDFNEAIVASGENPVDALAASTLTGKKEAPILLTNKNKIPKSIKKIIEDMDIGKITIVGGENSITDNVMDDMEDMYIRMYDELKKAPDDNPTLGIVLCSETDEDIARYSILHGNEQLFASKYKLYLPTEEELREEIETQKAIFYLQQKDAEEEAGGEPNA